MCDLVPLKLPLRRAKFVQVVQFVKLCKWYQIAQNITTCRSTTSIWRWSEKLAKNSFFIEHVSTHKQCVKSVRIRSYSSPHFPPFGLDTNKNNSEWRYAMKFNILLKQIVSILVFYFDKSWPIVGHAWIYLPNLSFLIIPVNIGSSPTEYLGIVA